MRKVMDLLIRVLGSVLSIQGINWILGFMGISIYVGINGYTLVVAAILGLPGILGLYLISYVM